MGQKLWDLNPPYLLGWDKDGELFIHKQALVALPWGSSRWVREIGC